MKRCCIERAVHKQTCPVRSLIRVTPICTAMGPRRHQFACPQTPPACMFGLVLRAELLQTQEPMAVVAVSRAALDDLGPCPGTMAFVVVSQGKCCLPTNHPHAMMSSFQNERKCTQANCSKCVPCCLCHHAGPQPISIQRLFLGSLAKFLGRGPNGLWPQRACQCKAVTPHTILHSLDRAVAAKPVFLCRGLVFLAMRDSQSDLSQSHNTPVSADWLPTLALAIYYLTALVAKIAFAVENPSGTAVPSATTRCLDRHSLES